MISIKGEITIFNAAGAPLFTLSTNGAGEWEMEQYKVGHDGTQDLKSADVDTLRDFLQLHTRKKL